MWNGDWRPCWTGTAFFYEKTEVWIDTERLYEALYVTEVLRTD